MFLYRIRTHASSSGFVCNQPLKRLVLAACMDVSYAEAVLHVVNAQMLSLQTLSSLQTNKMVKNVEWGDREFWRKSAAKLTAFRPPARPKQNWKLC